MKISVIVPVYNARKCVGCAIESVLLQSYKNYELILVNDGSKDGSLDVLYQYEAKYSCIKVLTQENAGPGVARNNGIACATGDYIFFLDADDYLPPNALERLVEVVQTQRYDIVKGMYYTRRTDKEQLVKFPWSEGILSRTGTKEEQKRYHQMKTSSAFGYLWGTLYRRGFLEKTKASLADIPLRFMEDTIYNLELFAYEPAYYVISEPVYVYVIQENSLSSKKDVDFFAQVALVVGEYNKFLRRNKIYESNLDLLIPLAARCFCWACISTLMERKVSFGELKNHISFYAEKDFMQKILNEKLIAKHLFQIGSKVQAFVFFVFCILLKWKWYGMIAFLFMCLKKPMDLYVKSALK